jgi:hypothetical protein
MFYCDNLVEKENLISSKLLLLRYILVNWVFALKSIVFNLLLLRYRLLKLILPFKSISIKLLLWFSLRSSNLSCFYKQNYFILFCCRLIYVMPTNLFISRGISSYFADCKIIFFKWWYYRILILLYLRESTWDLLNTSIILFSTSNFFWSPRKSRIYVLYLIDFIKFFYNLNYSNDYTKFFNLSYRLGLISINSNIFERFYFLMTYANSLIYCFSYLSLLTSK